MANVRRLVVGIDWGTHSSKWWYSINDSAKPLNPSRIPSVIDSTIYRVGDALTIYREKARRSTREDLADRRLKRLLLGDPQGASYWDAAREGIGISLGEASALTSACMFGDLLHYLRSEGHEVTRNTEVAIRFSLPNWIGDDPGHRAARRRMYETTVVIAGLLRQPEDKLPEIGSHVDISDWRDRIRVVKESSEVKALISKNPTTFAEMVEKEFRLGQVSWRLAAESSAAGYLPLEDLLREVPRNSTAQKHWVKLLIVDVGAGSTDTGYFVSSRKIDDHELMMNYLPPARTLDFAGESLTEMLRDFYIREHGRELSIEEAEVMKLSAPEKWGGQQFVKDWRDKIAKNVADYIFHVPDEIRLGEPAIPGGLKIVVTGGSGSVLGLDNSIKEAVVDALARRGVPGNVAARTELVAFRARGIADRVDALRRAVSIGEGHPDFALLSYREHLKRSATRVIAVKSWV